MKKQLFVTFTLLTFAHVINGASKADIDMFKKAFKDTNFDLPLVRRNLFAKMEDVIGGKKAQNLLDKLVDGGTAKDAAIIELATEVDKVAKPFENYSDEDLRKALKAREFYQQAQREGFSATR